MSDPERLLSPHSDADPLERALLGSLLRTGPSAEARAAAWQTIARDLSVAAAAGALAQSASTASAAGHGPADAGAASATGTLAGKAALAKVMMLVATLGAAGAGSSLWLHRAEPRAPATLPLPSPAAQQPLLRPRQPEPSPEQTCESPGAKARAPSEPERAPAERKPAREPLRSESRLITRARSALRSGNLAGAQAALGRLERHFPHGKLAQEREVLSIELYAAQGRNELARQRAQAFMAAHPESPHNARLARFLAAP